MASGEGCPCCRERQRQGRRLPFSCPWTACGALSGTGRWTEPAFSVVPGDELINSGITPTPEFALHEETHFPCHPGDAEFVCVSLAAPVPAAPTGAGVTAASQMPPTDPRLPSVPGHRLPSKPQTLRGALHHPQREPAPRSPGGHVRPREAPRPAGLRPHLLLPGPKVTLIYLKLSRTSASSRNEWGHQKRNSCWAWEKSWTETWVQGAGEVTAHSRIARPDPGEDGDSPGQLSSVALSQGSFPTSRTAPDRQGGVSHGVTEARSEWDMKSREHWPE